MELTNQERRIIKVIAITTPFQLKTVATIYKILQSFDETIAVINEAIEWGEDVEILAQEKAQKISTIIDKIEE